MSKSAIAFRRGQLIAGIESALAALRVAHRGVDLLSPEDRKLLWQSIDVLTGIDQRLWSKRP